MVFFDEIKNDVGITDIQLLNGYSCVNFSGRSLYLDGVVKIEKISSEEIIVRTRSAIITIMGDLAIKDISEDTLIIVGRIDCMSSRGV